MRRIRLLLTGAMLAFVSLVGAAPPAAFAVVGGTAVPDGKYPFVAALLDTRRPGSVYNQHFCGGTLIDPDSVLPAAHCVDSIFPSNLNVVVRRTQLSSNQGQLRQVYREYIPDGYNTSGPSKNDVAVLTLSSTVTGITPIRLPLSTDNWYEQPGKVQTVVGWGPR